MPEPHRGAFRSEDQSHKNIQSGQINNIDELENYNLAPEFEHKKEKRK